MKVESTAAVGIRNRETNHIDAVLAETTSASILTAPCTIEQNLRYWYMPMTLRHLQLIERHARERERSTASANM